MATSGSSNFLVTRNQIIRMAALEVNAIGAGETMGAQMLDDFALVLNAMVKAWGDAGLHVWTIAEATLFPTVGQVKYGMGTSATAHVTETYYETAITTDEASGQTVLSVDSTANMTALDNIGIMLDDGTIHWSTIASKTSTTVTINDALADSSGSTQPVFNYTSNIVRPLKIVDARRYNIIEANDTPIRLASRQEYNSLPRKTDAGDINEMFYDPQNTIGYAYIWKSPSPIEDLVKFTWYRPIQDFDAAADNPDLPQSWVAPLYLNLAKLLTGRYPVKDSTYQRIAAHAQQYLEMVSTFDREAESIEVQPDMGP